MEEKCLFQGRILLWNRRQLFMIFSLPDIQILCCLAIIKTDYLGLKAENHEQNCIISVSF